MKIEIETSQYAVGYDQLTNSYVDTLNNHEAQKLALCLVAERGIIKKGGQILSWSDFNENPDPLINRLLAKILVNKIDPLYLNTRSSEQIAILSIENSAGYLASEVSHQIEQIFKLSRPPRIIRARKSPDGSLPSPAMGEIYTHTTVTPITSKNVPRHLVASLSGDDLKQIRVLIPVDDFKATGDSLRGGIELGVNLLNQAGVPLSELSVIPLAGLGKPQQHEIMTLSVINVNIADSITALDVHFWPDHDQEKVFIEANGDGPMVMNRVGISDFTQ